MPLCPFSPFHSMQRWASHTRPIGFSSAATPRLHANAGHSTIGTFLVLRSYAKPFQTVSEHGSARLLMPRTPRTPIPKRVEAIHRPVPTSRIDCSLIDVRICDHAAANTATSVGTPGCANTMYMPSTNNRGSAGSLLGHAGIASLYYHSRRWPSRLNWYPLRQLFASERDASRESTSSLARRPHLLDHIYPPPFTHPVHRVRTVVTSRSRPASAIVSHHAEFEPPDELKPFPFQFSAVVRVGRHLAASSAVGRA